MTCDELLQALNEYVDGETASKLCEQFAEHLAGCDPCQVVVDNIRRSIALYRDGKPYPLPTEFQKNLDDCLQQRWREKFGDPG